MGDTASNEKIEQSNTVYSASFAGFCFPPGKQKLVLHSYGYELLK